VTSGGTGFPHSSLVFGIDVLHMGLTFERHESDGLVYVHIRAIYCEYFKLFA